MPIRLAQTALLATLVMLGACGTRGPVTLTPAQIAEQQAWQKARQQALQQAKQKQDSQTPRQDATTAVDTITTKEASR